MALLQIGVIPARYQSVRFPGKPLVKILGVPMVVRTWQQACLCKTLSKVIVATDDERIAEACRQEGAEVVMTSVSCANGAARPSAASFASACFQGAELAVLRGDDALEKLQGLPDAAACLKPLNVQGSSTGSSSKDEKGIGRGRPDHETHGVC